MLQDFKRQDGPCKSQNEGPNMGTTGRPMLSGKRRLISSFLVVDMLI